MEERFADFAVPTYDFVLSLKDDPRFISDLKFRSATKLLLSLEECYGGYDSLDFEESGVSKDPGNDVIAQAIEAFEEKARYYFSDSDESKSMLCHFWEFMLKLTETKLSSTTDITVWFIHKPIIERLQHQFSFYDNLENSRYWHNVIRRQIIGWHGQLEDEVCLLDMELLTIDILDYVFSVYYEACPPTANEYFELA